MFEGLSPFLIGTPNYIKRGLLDPLLRDWPTDKVTPEVWRGSFMSSGPMFPHSSDKVIVIAHSMGVASAIAWCNRWDSDGAHDIDLLLTLDPRPLHRPYVKPANVKHAVNFYRPVAFWMKGFPVEGAENIQVQCGHRAVPYLPEVRKLIESCL
jgi:hypothetical protein